MERIILNKQISNENKACEEFKYFFIQQYFNEERKPTCNHLLDALQHLYKDERAKDPYYSLYFQDFIQMFARDTMETLKFKRQHVFEAICKILL